MNYIPTEDVGEDTGALQEEYNVTVNSSPHDKNKKMTDNKEKNPMLTQNRLMVVAVLAFLIGFGLGFLVFSDRSDITADVITDDVLTTDSGDLVDTTITVEPVIISDALLVVEDQNFGETVVVNSVAIDRTSWIVVFEDNDGVAGSILGAQLYDAGEIIDGSISLLRGTIADSLYYVKVHSDDGDRQFDFTKDVPYLDESGIEVMTTFRTFTGTPR